MKKSFCLFCANYLPNLGGVEMYVYNLSKALVKHGHKVTIVTSNVFDLENYEILDGGVEIFRMPCYNIMRGRYPILKRDGVFKELDKKLSAKHFDMVVINARFYIHSIYAAKFALKNNIPCITVEHGSSHLSVDNKILDLFGNLYEHGITARLKRYCKDYYGVSETACEWSSHFGIKSKGTLYNAIDLEKVKKAEEKNICNYREILKIPKNATIISFTGRLLKIKGVYELLDAFKALNREDIYLIYAGDGSEAEELKNRASKNVLFLGRIDFEHVIALLKSSDIYCLPSVSEGMSTSVLEAIATETFVITTYNGGAREVIIGDEYGIITRGNTKQEIKTAIEKAMDPDYRTSATKKAYKRLEEGFTWEKTAEKLENITI